MSLKTSPSQDLVFHNCEGESSYLQKLVGTGESMIGLPSGGLSIGCMCMTYPSGAAFYQGGGVLTYQGF